MSCTASPEFDNRYRDAIKARHGPADVLAYNSAKRELEGVEGKAREEARPAPLAAAAKEAPKPIPKPQALKPVDAATPATGFDALPQEDEQHWRQHILNQLRAHVRFVPDQKTEADLVQALRDNPLAAVKGDPTGQVLIHYDKSSERPTRDVPPCATGRTAGW